MNKVYSNAEEVQAVLPQKRSVTLVGGCFDLIHVGHIHLLEYAASLEELLVVAVLSDRYARGYKDVERPIISQKQRAAMVASLRFVDFVYISDVSPSGSETLMLLKPSTVVFGEDSSNAEKMQQRIARVTSASPETKIKVLPRYNEEEISTSDIIKRIRALKS